MKEKIIVIAGPTASGKTAYGIETALKIGGEIVSADSMQIYMGLDITTAKPSKAELAAVPHHLISAISPVCEFSVADYVKLANAEITDIINRGKTPVIVGGTGLYISSLMNGIDFTAQSQNPEIRKNLQKISETDNGKSFLFERLKSIDPETADKISPNNIVRVIRALEVFETTGEKFSEYRKKNNKGNPFYDFDAVYLDFSDRNLLYERINRRVDEMIKNGMIDECKNAYEAGISGTITQAIGYKELLPFFNGVNTIDECTKKIKKATRNYAKRQLTWFRRATRRLIRDESLTEFLDAHRV
ncbi:MAG: tRNA (adenosine(37)-N6)-dimethylallyltransferase MiaA [Ruminococcus sp.]|jgi:tRNA dimethylallyltransferase|nr:tRNA (adenosine(37)-N6)-dimethylallyltransferase MiaA [Ruminococcus sp.]